MRRHSSCRSRAGEALGLAAKAAVSAASPARRATWPAKSPPAGGRLAEELGQTAVTPLLPPRQVGAQQLTELGDDNRRLRIDDAAGVQDDVDAFQIAGEQQQFGQQHARRQVGRRLAHGSIGSATASASRPGTEQRPGRLLFGGARLSLMALACPGSNAKGCIIRAVRAP